MGLSDTACHRRAASIFGTLDLPGSSQRLLQLVGSFMRAHQRVEHPLGRARTCALMALEISLTGRRSHGSAPPRSNVRFRRVQTCPARELDHLNAVSLARSPATIAVIAATASAKLAKLRHREWWAMVHR
jgi:hypothetical protein